MDSKDCEELPEVDREDVDDDPNDDVEGNREDGYRDLLDRDRLAPWCGVEGAVGGRLDTELAVIGCGISEADEVSSSK